MAYTDAAHLALNCHEKSYQGRTILTDVSLRFPSHGLFLILGPNGAGKTTLLSILSGLDSDFHGKLFYDSEEISRKNRDSYFDEHVTLVPQNSLVFDDLSVIDNILISDEKKDRKQAEKILEEFGLKDCIHSPTSSLSGGEKQRLAVARSFYHLKDIVLLDEVTAFLDKENREILFSAIRSISKDHLVLFVTQENYQEDFLSVSGIVNVKDGKATLELKEKAEDSGLLAEEKKSLSNNHALLRNSKRFVSFDVVTLIFVSLFSLASIVFGNLSDSLSEARIEDITYQNYLNTVNAYYVKNTGVDSVFGFTLSNVIEPIDESENIGSNIVGLFATDSFDNSGIVLTEGRYPTSDDEVILSSYCYQELGKEDSFTPFSFSMESSSYQVVGIYQGKESADYLKRMSLLKEETYQNPYNIRLRYSYSFGVESAFTYGETNTEDGLYLPASKDNQAYVDRTVIVNSFLSFPYSSLVNMNKEGNIAFSSSFFKAGPGYILFAWVFSAAIIALYLVLSFAFYARYHRSFLLLRVSGVSRKRLTTDVLLAISFYSLCAYLLGMAGSFLTTFLLRSHFQSLLPFLTSPLFLNYYLFFLLAFAAVLVGLAIFALMLFYFLSPKDNRKQLEEIKKK